LAAIHWRKVWAVNYLLGQKRVVDFLMIPNSTFTLYTYNNGDLRHLIKGINNRFNYQTNMITNISDEKERVKYTELIVDEQSIVSIISDNNFYCQSNVGFYLTRATMRYSPIVGILLINNGNCDPFLLKGDKLFDCDLLFHCTSEEFITDRDISALVLSIVNKCEKDMDYLLSRFSRILQIGSTQKPQILEEFFNKPWWSEFQHMTLVEEKIFNTLFL
jgi:hypothetical protein